MRRACLAAVVLFSTTTAFARGPEGRTVGIGICLPEPSGFTLEAYVSHSTAIDFVIGWDTFNNRNGYGHLDYLVMPVDLARGGSVSVPLYLGIGGWLIDAGGDLYFGARVPFGLALNFRSAPLQIFGELALKIILASPHDPGDRLDLDGDVGFRIFF